jgi:hypothetical protein
MKVLLAFYSGVTLSIASWLAIKSLETEGPLRRLILNLFRVPGIKHDLFVAEATRNLKRFLSSLSDQHLITGIAICLAVYIPICQIQVWHFFVGSHLAYLSLIVHLLTLHTLREHISNSLSKWRCRLRMFFILVNIALMSPSLYHIPIGVKSSWDVPPGVFPAMCLFSGAFHDSITAGGWVVFGIFISFLALLFTSVAFYILMDFGGNYRLRRWMARISGAFIALFLMLVIATSAYEAGSQRGSHPHSSNDWTFGQILPAVMLFLAPLSAWEMRYEAGEERLRQLERREVALRELLATRGVRVEEVVAHLVPLPLHPAPQPHIAQDHN